MDEPSPENVKRVVDTISVIFGICESDPLFSGSISMLEALHGNSIVDELKAWVLNPQEKGKLRDELVQRIVNLWGK